MTLEDLAQTDGQLADWLREMPEAVRRGHTVRTLPPGYIIHQKGSPLETAGILCSGVLRVINEFDTGNVYTIENDSAPDFIGDVTILAGHPCASVTLETVSECVVALFSREDFEEWLRGDPRFLMAVARRIAQKLYASSYSHGAELFYSPVRLLLQYLRARAGSAGGEVLVDRTRQQLSEELGLTVKTINRAVAKVRDAGLASLQKGKLRVDAGQYARICKRLEEWIDG